MTTNVGDLCRWIGRAQALIGQGFADFGHIIVTRGFIEYGDLFAVISMSREGGVLKYGSFFLQEPCVEVAVLKSGARGWVWWDVKEEKDWELVTCNENTGSREALPP